MACLLGLLVFITLTNPNHITLPLLITPFMMIGIVLYQLASLLMHYFQPGSNKLLVKSVPVSAAFIGVCLILLSSLHQLTWKDSFLVSGFALLFWLYMLRSDFLQK